MQIVNAKEIDVVMNMYNLIEIQRNLFANTLWQYYRDQPDLNNYDNVINFSVNDDTSLSYKYKICIIGRTGNDDTKNTERWVPVKYLTNFEELLKCH